MSFGRCLALLGSVSGSRVYLVRFPLAVALTAWPPPSRPRSLVFRVCVCVVRCGVSVRWCGPLLRDHPAVRPWPCSFTSVAPFAAHLLSFVPLGLDRSSGSRTFFLHSPSPLHRLQEVYRLCCASPRSAPRVLPALPCCTRTLQTSTGRGRRRSLDRVDVLALGAVPLCCRAVVCFLRTRRH